MIERIGDATLYLGGKVRLLPGDCREVLASLPDASVDAIVCDPPYGLEFMGKDWDSFKDARGRGVGAGFTQGGFKEANGYSGRSTPTFGKRWQNKRCRICGHIASGASPCKCEKPDWVVETETGTPKSMLAFQEFMFEVFSEALRVLKPGGHLVAFSGTRTYHRLACAIEDAGFEIRDQLAWVYGSGFPKSMDVAKQLDKVAGAEGDYGAPKSAAHAGWIDRGAMRGGEGNDGWQRPWMQEEGAVDKAARQYIPATDAARQWRGWGTALKPSFEPLCLAQKPLSYGQNIEIIGSTIIDLRGRLWSMLSAKDAAAHFGLSRNAYDVACGSARWSADDASNTRAALSAQMGTSQFVSALISSLNTVSSWNATLAAAFSGASTSTTETGSSTTTDLKTLRSCLSKITPASIIQAHRSGAWSSADASPAERYLSAAVMKLSAILELSAAESALSGALTDSPAAIGQIKPEWSSAVLARKPLIGTVAQNILAHGTGALNIDGCRVETDENLNGGRYADHGAGEADGNAYGSGINRRRPGEYQQPLGRWPANLCHDGSEEVTALFPETEGQGGLAAGQIGFHGGGSGAAINRHVDSGSAARFFYTSKADAEDRLGSTHPTVKPVDLMQWLVRLVCPKGGVVLDPFAGTGTTGEAAWREGMHAILIEREPEYQADIARRMDLATQPTKRAAVAATKNKLDDPNTLPLFAGAAE